MTDNTDSQNIRSDSDLDGFVHFRTQSSHSMLESSIKINQLIDLTKKHKMPAVCLTDRGNLFASLEFSMAAIKAGIQPICGAILNVCFDASNLSHNESNFAEILLIAKDEAGYKNLLKLASYPFIKNDRSICNHITFEDLIKHQEGIIALSAYTKGIIGKLLLVGNKEKALLYAQKLQKIFGNRFYFEIMRHGLAKEQKIEQEYLQTASDLHIPLIATNQVLFSNINMYDAHDVLLCISENVVRDVKDRKRVSNQCYFKSAEEMKKLFEDLPSAIKNTILLSKRCYVMAESRPPELPHFADGSVSEEDLIKQEAKQGLERKLDTKFIQENTNKDQQEAIKKEYFARLSYELDIICKMRFSGYFLIVSDFIRWSKKNGIAVGPGRGSGAGSIIAWVLDITDLDPIHFGLLFERFLNPERVSMPDFDIDFCQERREEVISYVRSKYGDDRVSQIITFGKMQAKAVIKDVSRVLGLRYAFADYLTELVPFNAINPVTLKQAISDVAELKDAYNGKGLYNLSGENELIKQVLDTSLILEGLHRHTSTHAAGIVIADQDIIETVPLYKDINSSMMIIQYSMKCAENAGLIKFDFLGLQTLTVITKCLELLKTQSIEVDIDNTQYNDAKTYKMLSKGLSTGVFQFESHGMKIALRKLRPDTIYDIISLGALYRPGPMENIPTYIACKHNKQKPDYLHPLLEPVLNWTYGVIIYQEQVMEIARRLAGYSLGGADLLRRAMGKKVKAEMDAQEELFVGGAINNKVPAKMAKSIFDILAKFAGYGFNKSHATAYGVISYQTAYLKANYTVEFLVASLNLDIDNSDKINIFMQEAITFGIKIIPPCINQSKGLFDILFLDESKKDKAIIFAIGAIKNVTKDFGNAIVEERNKNGIFKSITDFIERIDPKLINRRLFENIIKAGCFDALSDNRNSLLRSVSKIMAYGIAYHAEQKSAQCSFLPISSVSNNNLIKAEKLSTCELAAFEFEVFGLFLKNHPLTEASALLNQLNLMNYAQLREKMPEGTSQVKIAGVIIKKNSRMSKRGRFITLLLSDLSGIFEVTIFSDNVLKEYANLINISESVVITCDFFKDEGGIKIIAKEFMQLEELANSQKFDLYPKNNNDLEMILNIIERKDDGNKSKNNHISIYLPYIKDMDFVAKVKLNTKAHIKSQDIEKLNSMLDKSKTSL